ncbi:MAG: hypothetical protein COC06_03800 [Bacteroidales bacterium]|nr:MAG: hypothetical protein COC06_03800 [Bacteroidales bacterium]
MDKKLKIFSGILILFATLGFASIPLFFDRQTKELNEELITTSEKQNTMWFNMEQSKSWYHKAINARDHIEIMKNINSENEFIKTMYNEALKDFKYSANAAEASVKVYKDKQINLYSISKKNENHNDPDELGKIIFRKLKEAGQGHLKLETKISNIKRKINKKEKFKSLLWSLFLSIQGIGMIVGIYSVRLEKK